MYRLLLTCHSGRSEESRPLPFYTGTKDEILRHFVPQNDSGELCARLQFTAFLAVEPKTPFRPVCGCLWQLAVPIFQAELPVILRSALSPRVPDIALPRLKRAGIFFG